jgi:hypothetical protein
MRSSPFLPTLAGAAIAALVALVPASAAEIDQGVMMKWATVTQINYAITGVYDGPHTRLFTGGGGVADEGGVKDRVEIALRWDQTTAQLVGVPRFKNFKTDVISVRNAEPKCAPPVLNTPYEHFTLDKVEDGLGGALKTTSTRTFAGGDVATFCTGARVRVVGKAVQEPSDLVLPGAMLLAMPSAASGNLVSVDAKTSTIVTTDGKGWTWTFKLSPAK